MELDWHSIVRSDFPVTRQGYDPAAVQAHLVAVAEAIELLAETRRGSLAADLAGQVQSILTAAEETANQIREQAAARAIEVEHDVRETITRSAEVAVAQARHDAAQVTDASHAIVARLDTIGHDFTAMLDDLRARAEAISGAMAGIEHVVSQTLETEPVEPAQSQGPAWALPPPQHQLEGEEDDIDVHAGTGYWEEADGPEVAHEPQEEHWPEPEPEFEPPPPPAAAEPPPPPAAEPPPPPPPSAPPADDPAQVDSARLVALDMALGGHSRDAIDQYLAAHYTISNRTELVQEVMDAAGA